MAGLCCVMLSFFISIFFLALFFVHSFTFFSFVCILFDIHFYSIAYIGLLVYWCMCVCVCVYGSGQCYYCTTRQLGSKTPNDSLTLTGHTLNTLQW